MNLDLLLVYFAEVKKIMDRIFPENPTWENVYDYHYDLSDVKHPQWVKRHFPLMLIYYREKAGKLRKSKNAEVMYQNSHNILTQLVMTADDFGIYHRKNSHKGFSNIIAAVEADSSMMVSKYNDMQKPKKYRNFEEFRLNFAPDNLRIRALCEVLSENYPCNSQGQLKMFN